MGPVHDWHAIKVPYALHAFATCADTHVVATLDTLMHGTHPPFQGYAVALHAHLQPLTAPGIVLELIQIELEGRAASSHGAHS